MTRPRAAAPLLLLGALLPSPIPAQDADSTGPPAFVPLESPAAAAVFREAALLVAEKRLADAVDRLQKDVVDGPLSDRLVPLDSDRDTLEQARERAHRIHAADPALREAHRRRFGETAGGMLAAALRDGDPRAIRETFARFPLTDAGQRAGLLLAREAHRAGRPEEALGILDRAEDLAPREGGAPRLPPEFAAIRAAAAAATGEGDPAASLPAGPRGPLALLWSWPQDPSELPPPPARDLGAYGRGDLPAPADHLVAVQDGVVYWSDARRVTAIDLATGKTLARSAESGFFAGSPGDDEHAGETFAPAADARGVVAALDLAEPSLRARRAGTLQAFDPRGLRLLASRGSRGDIEHPEMFGRYVFHGRPLLLGDRVYAAATEASDAGTNAVGDVRTHVLAFRRRDLAVLWDTFVAYGSGILVSDVAPAGSLVHRHGRLYFATHTGLEACLDARTGGILWAHRYRTPESATTERLSAQVNRTTTPAQWPESPPVFSGGLVALAPRDSYYIEFLYERPRPGNGRVCEESLSRPRRDGGDLTVLWVLPGPAGKFFLAGQSEGPEEAPLLLRDLDPAAKIAVPWRGPVMEYAAAGLPVRAADAVYVATAKAVYRIPYPGRDGEIETLAAIPPRDPEKPRPSAGNLVVLPDRVLTVANDGILCFGPVPK